MTEKLEDRCKRLIVQHEYKECEKKLGKTAMLRNPHSAIPHNLMGILMEKENNHVLAMKHFRAAYALDRLIFLHVITWNNMEPCILPEDVPIQGRLSGAE